MENMDELIKYKELLDKGIITQEEFKKKKEELLEIKTDQENKTNKTIKQPVKKGKNEISIGQIVLIVFILLIIFGMIISTIIGKG